MLKAIWDAQKDNAKSINEIHKQYLPEKVDKDDYKIEVANMNRKLDKIFDKLDGKADKG